MRWLLKAKKEEADAISEILGLYEMASGQLINRGKSSVSFSPNTAREEAEEVKRRLGIAGETGIQMYLGLPAFSLRQKRLQFGYIRDRVQKKLLSWNQREFSAGGKEVLLKAVVQAIPTYAMQCFRIPETICADIDRLSAGFWWGDKAEGRKLHWSKWAAMCKPKDRGGMGFRDIRSFNRALLAKQVWRLATNPNSLVAKVFKARYFRNGSVMTAEVGSNGSFVWKSLMWSRRIIEEGSRWAVGDGRDISIWKDSWIVGLEGSIRTAGAETADDRMKVADLMVHGAAWDEQKLGRLFCPYIKSCILNTPIGEKGTQDEMRWKHDATGTFTVKTAYLLESGYYVQDPNSSAPDRKLWSRLVWNISIPPKAKVFLWRAFSNLIPTEANLKAHHVPIDGICKLCGDRWGSTEHCLLHCPKISMIWKESRFGAVVKNAFGLHLIDVAGAVLTEWGAANYEVWAVLIWQVWGYVCGLLHPDGEKAEPASEEKAEILWDSYQSARPTFQMAAKLGVELGEKKWQRPTRGRLRVDVDSMFNQEAHAFGVGIVVRDHYGEVKVALSRRTSPSSSVMMAEIMAVVHGIVLCVEHKLEPIEIYTDSFLAARVMADPEDEADLLPEDISEILERARSNILIGVYHMYRSANRVAHKLAQLALCDPQSQCWTANFPSWLREMALDDVA